MMYANPNELYKFYSENSEFIHPPAADSVSEYIYILTALLFAN